MKRITAAFLLAVLLLTLFACGEKESPAAYLPSIRYDNVPLQTYTIAIYKTNGTISVGGSDGVDETVKKNAGKVPFTEIADKEIKLVNGSDKNIEYSISFAGVYTEDGEVTSYRLEDLSTLPAGRYIICAQEVERLTEYTNVNLYMAGIDKK